MTTNTPRTAFLMMGLACAGTAQVPVDSSLVSWAGCGYDTASRAGGIVKIAAFRNRERAHARLGGQLPS